MKDSRSRRADAWALGIAPPPSRRHRGRGTLASLLILFAFSVGQASLTAIADQPATESEATDGAAAEATTSEETLPPEEAATEEVATEEVAAEEVTTDEDVSAEDPSADAEGTGNADAEEPAETTVDGSSDEPAAGSAPEAAAVDTPGPPSGDGVQPILKTGNPSCLDVMTSAEFLFEHKQDPPRDATITLTNGALSGTLVVGVNEGAQTFRFTLTGDFVAAGVIVKGGSNANFYDYRPDGNEADTFLHAPVNPSNGKFYGLSHISFCLMEDVPPPPTPVIDVEKSCPGSVDAGAEIEYTITVENTGDDALVDVSVDDTLLGDITGDFLPALSQGLAVGATATATVTHTAPGAGSVINTVTATGTGAVSDTDDSDTDSCQTQVTPPGPAIQIVKGGSPDLVHRGDTITYQFEVTNTGDVALFDVDLTDARCDSGTIDPGADVDGALAVDEVWHFTCTHLVTQDDPDPIPNTATVRGDTVEGEGGDEVTDQDTFQVDIIHPGISIVKTVSDDTVPEGTVVTYTYVVTNTGDTTLFNISVNDDVIGHIGTIASLAAGASATRTGTFTVRNSPTINIGTASGADILGRTVTAEDDAVVTPIAGSGGGDGPGCCIAGGGGGLGGTPFTGSEVGLWSLLAAALTLIGGLALWATRRRLDGPTV
jgi:uncharacterized repeat protein (TIGR01451 family)